MDLLSLVLTLRPLRPNAPDQPLPLWWGRAAHALLLQVVRQADPALAASLHHNSAATSQPQIDPQHEGGEAMIKPFTTSTLMGRFPQGRLQMEQPYRLRLTAFRADLAHILWQAAQQGSLARGAQVELDYHPFVVEKVEPLTLEGQAMPTSANSVAPSLLSQEIEPSAENPASPWAAATTYQELAAEWLLARRAAPRRISLQFTSPTTFKSAGMHLPVPLPHLVFGSLLERWNACAPIAFPPEARRYAAECLALGRYRLSSRQVPVKGGGLRVGAVGEVTYTSLNYDRYWMSLMAILAAFALFCGVGAGSTMGLGQVRLLPTTEMALED